MYFYRTRRFCVKENTPSRTPFTLYDHLVHNDKLKNKGSFYYWIQYSSNDFIIFLGLWNYVFLFSNLSLFVFIPFAYLFTESEGFFGHRKGLMARVYETFIVLLLLAMVVLGITYIVSALIDKDNSSIHTILSKCCFTVF